ncbi:MAG: hypothetical protein MR384_08795 [Lachnospiraceae bacterium]|nr:hypothetical protein [Lachnospiraceae bacterium]
MEDQSKFLEMLEEIKNIAVSQQNKMTKDEIKSYLSDMQMDEGKFEAVYHYLASCGVEIEGYDYVPVPSAENEEAESNEPVSDEAKTSDIEEKVKSSEKGDKGTSAKERAEINRKLYEQEVNSIEKMEGDSLTKAVESFLDGDEKARDTVINNYLKEVIKIAGGYKEREAVKKEEVTIDDLISEGNLGLLIGISVIEQNKKTYIMQDGKPNMEAIYGTIHMEIVNAIENSIDDVTKDKDWESAVLARTNLLNEAAKYLTEEIGRVPTKEELSDYTKIPKEEIESIMGLSEDAKRVAK